MRSGRKRLRARMGMMRTRQHGSGFTLIELLVVIVIIGILAGIMLPAFGRIRLRAKTVKGQTQALAIMSGIKAYYLEYGEWPLPGGEVYTPDKYTHANDNASAVIDRLHVNSPNNPNGVIFLEVDGLTRSGGNSGPYGVIISGNFSPFSIAIDTRYPALDCQETDGVSVTF